MCYVVKKILGRLIISDRLNCLLESFPRSLTSDSAPSFLYNLVCCLWRAALVGHVRLSSSTLFHTLFPGLDQLSSVLASYDLGRFLLCFEFYTSTIHVIGVKYCSVFSFFNIQFKPCPIWHAAMPHGALIWIPSLALCCYNSTLCSLKWYWCWCSLDAYPLVPSLLSFYDCLFAEKTVMAEGVSSLNPQSVCIHQVSLPATFTEMMLG